MTPEERKGLYYQGSQEMQPYLACLTALANCGPNPRHIAFWRDCVKRAELFAQIGKKMMIASEKGELPQDDAQGTVPPSGPPQETTTLSPDVQAATNTWYAELEDGLADLNTPTP